MDEPQQRLLEAAGQVFAEKGFKSATVREIVASAGLKNIAAVNYYFGDKLRLYDASLRYAFRCRADQLPMPRWSPDTPPDAKLREFVRELILHMLTGQQPWQMRLLMQELSNPSEVGRGLVRDFIRPVYEVLWAILREWLGPEVPEEQVHLIGFSIVGQIFYQRVAGPVINLVVGAEEHQHYHAERLAEHITQFSLNAVRGFSDASEERLFNDASEKPR